VKANRSWSKPGSVNGTVVNDVNSTRPASRAPWTAAIASRWARLRYTSWWDSLPHFGFAIFDFDLVLGSYLKREAASQCNRNQKWKFPYDPNCSNRQTRARSVRWRPSRAFACVSALPLRYVRRLLIDYILLALILTFSIMVAR